jgi:hypothetical protein
MFAPISITVDIYGDPALPKRLSAFTPVEGESEEPVKHHDMWWTSERHPLSDDDFKLRFMQHMLLHSQDRSLKGVRNRAYFLIKQVMGQQMDRELDMYREDYPWRR